MQNPFVAERALDIGDRLRRSLLLLNKSGRRSLLPLGVGELRKANDVVALWSFARFHSGLEPLVQNTIGARDMIAARPYIYLK